MDSDVKSAPGPSGSVVRALFDAVGFVILALLAVAFVHTQVRNGYNIPWWGDDTNFYLGQFMERFLDADSVSEKIAYFFSASNHPHAKLSGRLISYVHYLLFGTVDYRFLIVAGSCVLCAFVFAVRFTLIGNFLLAVPLGVILLAPHWTNYWVALITGYPFLLLYAALIYWLFSRKRDLMALPLCAVASFTHSPGLLVFVPVLVVLLLSRPIDFRRVALWGLVFVLTIVLYYFFVLQHGPSIIRTDQTASIGQSLLSKILYGAKFVMLPFVPFLGKNLWGYLALAPVFALPGLAFAHGVFRRGFLACPDKRASLAFYLFCLAPLGAAMAAVDDPASLTDGPAARYLMYSLMAWSGTYAIASVTVSKFSAKSFVALVFSAMFIMNSYHAYRTLDSSTVARLYSWYERGTSDADRSESLGTAHMAGAVERGIFAPSFPGSDLLEGPVPPVSEWNSLSQLETVHWYWLGTNDDFILLKLLGSGVPGDDVSVVLSTSRGNERFSVFRPAVEHVMHAQPDAQAAVDGAGVNRNELVAAAFARQVSGRTVDAVGLMVDGRVFELAAASLGADMPSRGSCSAQTQVMLWSLQASWRHCFGGAREGE